MKKISFLIVLALLAFTKPEVKISDAERQMAVEHLTKTKDLLYAAVEDLSAEQLNYKKDMESWSVAECVEHLAISEINFDDMLRGSVSEMADVSKRDQVSMTDDQLLAMITDRSDKIKTSEAFEPSGKFGSYEQTLATFLSERAKHIEYVSTTDDDLRHHYSELPFGTIDAYQVVLFMSGHTERHTKQIEEVIADPGFPKN